MSALHRDANTVEVTTVYGQQPHGLLYAPSLHPGRSHHEHTANRNQTELLKAPGLKPFMVVRAI